MNIMFFISLLFALQVFYWFVGKCASNNLNSKIDYFLAGQGVRVFPLLMTFLATQVGGGLVLGAAEEAYQYGWPVLLYPLGASLGLILLGLGIGRKLAQFKVLTVAEILEQAYGSKMLKKIASLLSIVTLFMILVAQIIASQKFLASLGFNNPFLFVLFWGLVIFYTAQGGMHALISTDIVQALFFSAVFLFCFFFVFNSGEANVTMAIPQWSDFSSVSSKLSGWLLMPLLFMFIEQDMGQRCFAAYSPKALSKATILAGLGTLIICMIPVYFGVLARTVGLDVDPGASVLMAIIEKMSNPWVAALVGCAVLAAVISTASSLINSISSNLANDFEAIQKILSVRFMQIITIAISLAAICFAFQFNNIVNLLIQSYELSVSCLFVPICIALFKKKCHLPSAMCAICFGALSFFMWRFFPLEIPREIASVGFSCLGFIVGEFINAFKRYKVQHESA